VSRPQRQESLVAGQQAALVHPGVPGLASNRDDRRDEPVGGREQRTCRRSPYARRSGVVEAEEGADRGGQPGHVDHLGLAGRVLGSRAALVDLQLSDGSYLVGGRTVTGFANVEEDFSDAFVGQKVMPFRVEDELRRRGANYVQGGLFKAFAVRDGRLITGQQQYSARKVAEMLIEALGI